MATTQLDPVTDAAKAIERIFNQQKANSLAIGKTTAKARIAKLNRLLDAVMRYRPEMKAAMYADFKKPAFEVDAVEVYPITGAIKHTRRHLRQWMQPQPVPTSLAFTGSSSQIVYESKGVALIISPWNFPFNLTFVPLVSAIAAGNCAVLKPSEFTPHSSALIRKIVAEVFEENEVAVVEGGIEASQALLALPFHHIFFTGAPSIGKIVMQAAAKNLTSCTLELGGKSPTIIDETADLTTASARIAFAKWANCGQICTGCDYLLVHESRKDELLALLSKRIREFYGEKPAASGSYPRIVNARNFHRLNDCLTDARRQGAKVIAGGDVDESQCYIAPTLVADAPADCRLMQEEIFGPILPVNTYRDLQKAIDFINSGERPLTMNIFSKNRRTVRKILQETRSGGVTINNATMHFYNHDLPFGGINNSGIGKSHGFFGFQDFSNARAVYRQHLPGALDLLRPPYNKWKERMIDLTIRWL
jgi:aldehyde dehydrogenase (NAD+)